MTIRDLRQEVDFLKNQLVIADVEGVERDWTPPIA